MRVQEAQRDGTMGKKKKSPFRSANAVHFHVSGTDVVAPRAYGETVTA